MENSKALESNSWGLNPGSFKHEMCGRDFLFISLLICEKWAANTHVLVLSQLNFRIFNNNSQHPLNPSPAHALFEALCMDYLM